jgi:hypothetical protein
LSEWLGGTSRIERVAIYSRESDQLTGERLEKVQSEQRTTARCLRQLLVARRSPATSVPIAAHACPRC